MKQIRFITNIFASFFILSFGTKKFETKDITITKADGTVVSLNVELAKTVEEREQGFMFRKKIPDGTGMLFIFEEDDVRHFWMKNTPTALSIAYIDRNGIIRDILDMVPYSTDAVSSTTSVRYALEVPKGWFLKQHIKAGDKVSVN